MRNPTAAGVVSEVAELVLPWLPPPDLATAASASRAIHAVASAVTARRATDSARRLEVVPIPFDNPIDSKPYAYFLYTPFSLTPSPASPYAQPWGCTWVRSPGPTWPRPDLGLPSAGCACVREECGSARCACADAEAEMAVDSSGAGMGNLKECGDGCLCGPSCGNRPTQRGVTVRLRIVRQLKKGWGLHAAEALHSGQFVCEYAGKVECTAL